ncbi:MAG: hypothetical protein WAL98_09090 [Desulfatiglandaceae bacterium]|jgi:hypothetical protein
MKKFLILQLILAALFVLPGHGNCDPLDDLMQQFGKEYEADKPPSPYSSVNSDYKLSRTALSSLYTTKTLALLYRQNQQLLDKYNEMILKYDRVIDQNNQIIELLSVIARKGESEKAGVGVFNR